MCGRQGQVRVQVGVPFTPELRGCLMYLRFLAFFLEIKHVTQRRIEPAMPGILRRAGDAGHLFFNVYSLLTTNVVT